MASKRFVVSLAFVVLMGSFAAIVPAGPASAAPIVLATIPVGHSPTGIAVDPILHRVLAVNHAENTVSVIDSLTNQVIDTIGGMSLGCGDGDVAIDAALSKAYVSDTCDGLGAGETSFVYVIDELTDTVTGTVSFCCGGAANTLDIDTATHRVFVVNGGASGSDNKVWAFDGSTDTFLGLLGPTAYQDVAVNSQTHKVYLSQGQTSSTKIAVIDGATLGTDIIVPITPPEDSGSGGIAADPGTNLVYTSNSGSGNGSAIIKFDGSNNTEVGTIGGFNSPGAVAIDPNAHFLYVCNSGAGGGGTTVSILDTNTSTIITSLDVGAQPQDVAFDADSGLAYVTVNNDTVKVIGRAATTTGVTSSLNLSLVGESVTFTASVAAVAPGTGTPTGTVEFDAGADVLGTIAVDGAGNAELTTTTLPAGAATVTATYSGDISFRPSSANVSQVVKILTDPVSASITANEDAVWTVPIVNDTALPFTGVTAVLHANANGSTPLGFDETLMTFCDNGGGPTETCNLPDIPAFSTVPFNVVVPTTGLTGGTAVTGDIDVSATSQPDAFGVLGAVTVVSCGAVCVKAAAIPGITLSSSDAPPTAAHPTKQVITLPPDQAGAPPQPPIAVTLNSLAPAAAPVADRALCPITGTQTRCSGQISVAVGDFSSYTNKAHPITIKIIAKWATVVPAGKILMKKDIAGPPIQLPTCVLNATTHRYNTPCARPQFVAGSAATHNLTTTNTILLNGNDVHFARRVVVGPNAPTLVKATAGVKKAVVSWKAPTVTNGAITGYSVTAYIGTVAKKTVLYKSALLKQTMTGLLAGKTYTFKVIARNAKGTSLLSIASNGVKPT